MKAEPRDESRDEVLEKVQKHLEAIAELIAPRECPVHGTEHDECGEEDCDVEWKDAHYSGEFMLSEWILLSTWTSMETGDSYTKVHNRVRMMRSHLIGLLSQVLEEF